MTMKRIAKLILKKLFKPLLRKYYFILGKLENLENLNRRLEYNINCITNKLSLMDESVEFKGARFFVPNAPRDHIQNIQLSHGFYELDILQSLDTILNNESVIVDIGANVGNHTVYWGKITNVKKIYAFEPVKSTFNILSRNIELNNLGEKVTLFNMGLSDITTIGKIESYVAYNIGGTVITKDSYGDIKLNKLDNINEIMVEAKVDFIKIDVEGAEKDVLTGAEQFLNKHKPAVFIESFAGEYQYDFVRDFFKKLNYNEPVNSPKNDNYLFIPI